MTKTVTEGVSAGHLSTRSDLTVSRLARGRLPIAVAFRPIAIPGPGTLMCNLSRKYLATAIACLAFRVPAWAQVKVSYRPSAACGARCGTAAGRDTTTWLGSGLGLGSKGWGLYGWGLRVEG